MIQSRVTNNKDAVKGKKPSAQSSLGQSIDFSAYPEDVVEKLKAQDKKPEEKNVWNASRTGAAKTLYEREKADDYTAILGKSYDFVQKKKNPRDPDKKNFPKFKTCYGIYEYSDRFYNLSNNKLDKIAEYASSPGIPRHVILRQLPDDGKKYNQHHDGIDSQPLFTVHSMLKSSFLDDKDHIVWEENPHKPDTFNLRRSPCTDKGNSKDGIIGKLEKYDLLEEIDDDRFRAEFIISMMALQDKIDTVEEQAEMTASEGRLPTRIRDGNDSEEVLWQRFYITPGFKHYIRNKISKLLRKIETEIHDRIDKYDKQGDIGKVKELGRLKRDLETLKNLNKGHITLNWKKTYSNASGTHFSRGYDPFSVTEGRGSSRNTGRKEALLTVSRQYLDILKEKDAKVTINYAYGCEELINNAIDAEKFEADIGNQNHAKLYQVDQSFARSRLSKQRQKHISAIKKIMDSLGEGGLISYREKGIPYDLYFGNARGHEIEGKFLIVAGTPRLDEWLYGLKTFLHFGKFPGTAIYDNSSGYGFPRKERRTSYTVEGYEEDEVDLIYQHEVLNQKMDAFRRVRGQFDEHTDIEIVNLGYLPDSAYFDYLGNSSKYDRVESLTSDLIKRVSEESCSRVIEDFPVKRANGDLPKGVWMDGKDLRISNDEEAQLKEYVKKNQRATSEEIADFIGCSKRTVSRMTLDGIVTVQRKGKSNIFHEKFELQDLFG